MIRNEQNTISDLKAGSVEAFDDLYRRYHPRLYNFALKISGGDRHQAEELTQGVFIRLWEVRESVDEEKNLMTFLCTIAKNRFLNDCSHRLVRYVHQEYVLKSSEITDFSTEMEVDRSLLDQLIDELTEKLPVGRKKIFIMSRREGKSNKEISRILNITESTIETQLGKAVKYIRMELAKHYTFIVALCAAVSELIFRRG